MGRSRRLQLVPPGYVYSGTYINVRSPNSEGWHLVGSSPSGIEFARQGETRGESFGAQVLIFPLELTKSNDEFVALIKKNFEKDTDAERYRLVKSEFDYSGERSYPCVRFAGIIQDKQAQVAPNVTESLLLQVSSLYCRHPIKQETGFCAAYSHRGRGLDPNLNSEAKEFIEGIRVPGE